MLGPRSGRFRRRANERLRPTTGRVLGALFSMLGPDGVRGRCVADIYAGTGAFGIEALRRGARRAVFVEQDGRLCGRVKQALLKEGFGDNSAVRRGDAISVLGTLDDEFDLVFADPPYILNPFERLLGRLTDRGLLKMNAVVYLEHSARSEPSADLPGVRLTSRRRYGDSAVSVYRKTEGLGVSQPDVNP